MTSVSHVLARLVVSALLALGLANGRPTGAVPSQEQRSLVAASALLEGSPSAWVEPDEAHLPVPLPASTTGSVESSSSPRSGEHQPYPGEAAGTASPARSTSNVRRVYRICRVTAYCDRGMTAGGTESGVGQCAAPADIPLGAKVYIPELGRTFLVTDRTHQRFRHNTVDLFVPVKDQCLRFGRQYLECEFTLPTAPWQRPPHRLAAK